MYFIVYSLRELQKFYIGTMFCLRGQDEFVVQQYKKFHPNPDTVLPILRSAFKWITPHGHMRLVLDLWRNCDAINAVNKMKIKGTIPRVLLVTGLPRTGSTKLHRLLYADPASGGLDGLHAIFGAKPILPHDVFDKILNAEGVQGSHPIEATQAEEEFFFLERVTLALPLFLFGIESGDVVESVDKACKEFAKGYPWFKEEVAAHAVRLGHNEKPLSHLIMKSPLHTLNLEVALEVFGQNTFWVSTTRCLTSCVPSTCKLFGDWARSYFDVESMGGKLFIGERVMTMLKHMSEAIEDAKSQCNIVVDYDELESEPIAAVEKLYALFGQKVSEAHRQGMKDWLASNPQGKFGRSQYSLEEYGLEATATGGVRCVSNGCTVEPIQYNQSHWIAAG